LALVWSLDSAPFGTSAFRALQQEVVQDFLDTGTSGHVVQLMKGRIANDFDMAHPISHDDDSSLLRTMVDALKGGDAKGDTMKMSRWISWMRNFRNFRQRHKTWCAKLAIILPRRTKIQGKPIDRIAEADPHAVLGEAKALV
jgi:hypothetical protein